VRRFTKLQTRLAEIVDLGKTSAILAWDQQGDDAGTGCADPSRAALDARRIAHEKFTSAENRAPDR